MRLRPLSRYRALNLAKTPGLRAGRDSLLTFPHVNNGYASIARAFATKSRYSDPTGRFPKNKGLAVAGPLRTIVVPRTTPRLGISAQASRIES